jgi:hypothetical protein
MAAFEEFSPTSDDKFKFTLGMHDVLTPQMERASLYRQHIFPYAK